MTRALDFFLPFKAIFLLSLVCGTLWVALWGLHYIVEDYPTRWSGACVFKEAKVGAPSVNLTLRCGAVDVEISNPTILAAAANGMRSFHCEKKVAVQSERVDWECALEAAE